MPGTVQVSVLGLMDLPPSGQLSSTPASSSEERLGGLFSLKIAMGKTEYRTGDRGDFSFPVSSLRENLKVTLHDADGNEISRTEVKTMVVVEKRFWDGLFSLEGGGCVHLKLQFVLNAEEHKRIREMRETVLKRRHGDLTKSSFKDSFAAMNVSENTIGSPDSFSAEERCLSDELTLTSRDGTAERLVASPSQDLQQQTEFNHERHGVQQSKVKKDASGIQVNPINICEINASLEETLDLQVRCSESLVTEEITTTTSSSAMTQEETKFGTRKESVHEKLPVSNIKKMISAFERIPVQEPRTRAGSTTESWVRRAKRVGSSGAPWLKEMNTEKVTVEKTMPKSFLTGTLSEMKSTPLPLVYVDVQEEEEHSDLAISKKNMGNFKQFVESNNVQNNEKVDPVNKKATSEFLYAAGTPSCERISDSLEVIETKEVVTFCKLADLIENVDQYPSIEAKEGTPITFQPREYEAVKVKIESDTFPVGVSFSDSATSYVDMTTSGYFERELGMLGSKDLALYNVSKGKEKIHPGDHLWSFHTSQSKKDEEAFVKDSILSRKKIAESAITEQCCNLSMLEEQPTCSLSRAERGFSSTGEDIYELTTYGSSDVKLDMLTYFDLEHCLLGSQGNFIPRHLCITSGSKRLKDIIGGFM